MHFRVEKMSGCSSVWLERLTWTQGVAGSNPAAQTNSYASLAQLAEYRSRKAVVPGSIPGRGSMKCAACVAYYSVEACDVKVARQGVVVAANG